MVYSTITCDSARKNSVCDWILTVGQIYLRMIEWIWARIYVQSNVYVYISLDHSRMGNIGYIQGIFHDRFIVVLPHWLIPACSRRNYASQRWFIRESCMWSSRNMPGLSMNPVKPLFWRALWDIGLWTEAVLLPILKGYQNFPAAVASPFPMSRSLGPDFNLLVFCKS